MTILLFMLASGGCAEGSEFGVGRTTADLNGTRVTVFTYRPWNCALPSLLFVFHGNSRTAERSRDQARPLADRLCLVVLAPLFDAKRFPDWLYHRGGIVHEGRVRPRAKWTVRLVAELVAWARDGQARPDAPYYLFGHSAGGQFLSRVAAFAPPQGVKRIVIANPSSQVATSLDEAAPYGFGKVFGAAEGKAQLRRYLSLPITIFLGAEDTGSENLLSVAAARRQGVNRLDRGRNVFQAAKSLARTNGWPFNWRLVIAPNVAHSSRDMLRSDQVGEAFGWSTSGAATSKGAD